MLCQHRNSRRKTAALILALAALFFLPASCKLAHSAILRKQAEQALQTANEQLEQRVAQRTAELQQQEAKVQQAQKTKSLGDLAGGIAHDFNNLLMAIQGNVDLGLLNLKNGKSPLKFLHEIQNATSRAANLAKQMLAYSGRGHFVIEAIQLNTLISEMQDLLRSSISRKVELRLTLRPELPTFNGDVTQIKQVLLNLVNNASESIESSTGLVELKTGTEDFRQEFKTPAEEHWPADFDGHKTGETLVFFEVCDTGSGMDQGTIGSIFDPFFTTKFTGRGLGMSAVLGIVRGHRGGIRIHSEPGIGSVFRIMFPVESRTVPGQSPTKHSASPGQAPILTNTILVVDDEAPVREVLKAMLEHLGFTVLIAGNGKEGLKVFLKHKNRIRCTLLDLTMPQMDGEETFKAIRKTEPEAQVFICSGFDEQEVVTRFANTGLAGFLKKPFNLSSLEQILLPGVNKDSPD